MQKLARATKIACAAVALAALAAAPAALAQTTSRRSRQQAPAKVPAAAPAPAPLAAAPVAPAPILEPRASDDGPRIVALAGVEAPLGDDGDTRLKVQLEVATELARIGPRARLEGVVSAGFIPYSKSETVMGIDTKLQSNAFELVPAFRFSFGVGQKITLQADTGIGATYVMTKSTVGSETTTDASWGEVLRFAAGLAYDVNDHLRLGGRVGLDFLFHETTSKAIPLFFEASLRM